MPLILTRAIGQQIKIGPNIVVTFQGMDGSRARIAIDAPKDIRILRAEVIDRDEQAESEGEA